MALEYKQKMNKKPCSDLPIAYQLELHRIIEVDAYLRAEADGFRRSPLDYWLAAEKEVKC